MADDKEETRLVLEEMDPTLALMAGTKGKETTLEARDADKERRLSSVYASKSR